MHYQVDLNCDMGEGIGNDAAIMPFISSASIACGFHAGDVQSISDTLQLAKNHGVLAGAHPSFPDRENFGRSEMNFDPQQVYEMVSVQVDFLVQLCRLVDISLHHVKPHGALYNMSAKDRLLARAIVDAVKAADPSLVIYGLSGSLLISEATAAGLPTRNEVFADRTYQDDGSLTPRHKKGAMIEDPAESIRQVMQMLKEETVQSVNGKTVPVIAETICIHGDNRNAEVFAKQLNESLTNAGFHLK